MQIIWKHIWRNICENRLRNVLVILSLTLAAAVFYLNIGIRRNVLDNYAVVVENEFAGYDLCVTKDNGELFFVDEIDTAALGATRSATAAVFDAQAALGGARTEACVVAIHAVKAAQEGLVHITQGTPRLGGVILSEQQAAYYCVGVGDAFRIYTRKGDADLTVCALCDSAGVLNLGTRPLTVIADFNAFSQEATMADVAQAAPLINGSQAGLLLLDLPKGTDFDAACAAFGEKNEGFSATNLHGAQNSFVLIGKINLVLTVILFVVTVICYYVASSVSSLLLQMRLSVIGTFRSIGASRFQTNMILLAENLLVGLIAGVASLIPGEILRVALLNYYTPQAGYEPPNIYYMLLTVVFSMALQAAIALPAVIRAGRRSIRDNIFHKITVRAEISKPQAVTGALLLIGSVICFAANRHYHIAPATVAFVSAIVGMGLLAPFLAMLLSRALTPLCERLYKPSVALGVKRMYIGQTNRMSVVLVSVATAMVLTILLCVSSLNAYFDGWAARFDRDIFIKGTTQPVVAYAFLQKEDGVETVFFQHRAKRNIVADGAEMRIYFTARGGFDGGIALDDGLLDGLADGNVIVDEMWAGRYGYSVGDTITVVNADASRDNATKQASFSLTIAGLCDSSLFNNKRTTWILTENDYFSYINETAELVGITLADGVDADAVCKKIYADIMAHTGEPALVMPREAYFNEEMALGYDALSVISAVPILAVLLSVVGLVNNLVMSFDQKKREYAVLYSVAMSRRQLAALVLAEPAGVFLSGVATGGVFTLYLAPVIRDLIYSIVLQIEPRIDPLLFAAGAAAVFLLVCLTCLVPLKLIKKMDIITEIKYE